VIVNQIKQYETMVQNLQRIPEGVNILQVVAQWGNQITGLLGTARIITYNLDNVMTQFTALYQDLGVLQTSADIVSVRNRLLSGRMEASQTTVQVTAIQANLTDLYSRMCALLDAAYTAHGNLDIQQIQAMQLGLVQHTLESSAAMQATHARNTAQYHAEQVAIERMQLQALQGAHGSIPEFTTPQGKLPRFHW
jgi:hypothetical protein